MTTRPGEHTKSHGKWPFIADFPINSMVIFHCYVSSPEGKHSLGLSLEKSHSISKMGVCCIERSGFDSPDQT